ASEIAACGSFVEQQVGLSGYPGEQPTQFPSSAYSRPIDYFIVPKSSRKAPGLILSGTRVGDGKFACAAGYCTFRHHNFGFRRNTTPEPASGQSPCADYGIARTFETAGPAAGEVGSAGGQAQLRSAIQQFLFVRKAGLRRGNQRRV